MADMGLNTYFKRVLCLQSIAALAIIIALLIGIDLMAAWSALLACLVFAIPQAVFGKMLFARSGASESKYIIGQFYRGEFLKIAISVLLFAAVFKWHWVQALPFFMAYIFMYLTTIIIAHRIKATTS